MVKKSLPEFKVPPASAENQPATRKMLRLVRDELKSDIQALGLKTDSRFGEVSSKFEEVRGDLSRMQLLFEEQNSNNRIVLEGLQALWQRQAAIEQRLS